MGWRDVESLALVEGYSRLELRLREERDAIGEGLELGGPVLRGWVHSQSASGMARRWVSRAHACNWDLIEPLHREKGRAVPQQTKQGQSGKT
jgi:hypothetical protein